LWSSDYVFVVNATIGTPGQNVGLIISPSTSDTWVPDATSSYCNYTVYSDYYYNDDGDYVYNTTYTNFCPWGSYDQSASSTYQQANSKFRTWNMYSPDSTSSDGSNFTDTLRVGNIELANLPMGLADSSDQWIGVLGLGSNYSYYGGTYSNFPDRLVESGQIATKAYSIWLEDEEGKTGSLLMGAVDTARYKGTLTRIDGYASSAFYGSFGVSVTGLNGSSSSTAALEAFTGNDLPFDASIGPAETFSNLPDALAKKVWSMAGATFNSSISLATIPCDAATKATDGGARFAIQLAGSNGPVLDVRLADLIVRPGAALKMWGGGYSRSAFAAPPNTCLFGVQNGTKWNYYSSSSSPSYYYYNLGSALLRRSYMVFDIPNEEVALAPVVFGTAASPQVVAFASYGAPAPSATKYCGDSTDSYRSYYCDPDGSSTPGSGSGSGSSNGTSNFYLNTGVVAGLSVAFGLVSILALLAAFAVWRKLCCFAPRGKSAKGVETDVEDGDAVQDHGPAMQQAQGPPIGALSTVREETTETSSRGPQLPPRTLLTEHEQTSRTESGRDMQQEHRADHQASGSHGDDPTGAPLPVSDNGKGKEVATHEERQ
jgi:hypothetical protein